MIKLKPGFHIIVTIAVIAAVAETKKNFSDRSDHSDHMKPLSSDRSDNNPRDIKSSISEIVVTAIAELFFLSDRSGHSDRSVHMETGLNLSQ